MKNQIIRYILWISCFFILFILFNTWQNEKNLLDNLKTDNKIKNININSDFKRSNITYLNENVNEIMINTNLISAKIDLNDGDISYFSLKKYNLFLNNDNEKVILFDKLNNNFCSIKFGFLINEEKKIDKIYNLKSTNFSIDEKDKNLVINLEYKINEHTKINKVYTFKSYSYDINLDFFVTNSSKDSISGYFFGLINYKNIQQNSNFLTSSNKNYINLACYTNAKPYKKIEFENITTKDFSFIETGGWIAFFEQYFLFSWIPNFYNRYVYSIEKKDENFYTLKCFNEDQKLVLPGDCIHFNSKLYLGPKIKDNLIRLHKGLDLSIDYGIFWPIASPMFLLLNKIYFFVNNWGLAIILITLMIKLLFFHLASVSYKSMGRMKTLQPRLDLLKEKYKDDKKMFGHAVLDLYKKEKVNPLSGCFPIIIQIPFFISLYYVLLESVELRHAPFLFWIQDLSNKDPYYILPVLMSLTIFIQQKMNPPLQDQTQKKIMDFLPFLFLLIFLQFPSGLILYWIINNILSIIQQFFIVKNQI